jgi:hypothetical protein
LITMIRFGWIDPASYLAANENARQANLAGIGLAVFRQPLRAA